MDVNAELPPDFEWYQNQIAGHLPSVVRNGVRQIGILRERGRTDIILKLVQEGIRGQREIGFYRRIAALSDAQRTNSDHRGEAEEDTLLKELALLIPRFYGCREILLDENDSPKEFLQLEDVTEKFKFPCIMDVKMGRVSADPLATEEKRLAEEVKSPLQKKIGFRILGHKVQNENGFHISRDRIWGRERTEENIEEAFVEYLTSLRATHEAFAIADAFVKQLDQVLCWFQRQKIAHFYASSLLFVYEGHSKGMPVASLCMIDFSHVFFVQKTEAKMDENYMFGLLHIIQLFRKIRRDLLCAMKVAQP